jgi:hypothetical protein
MHIPLNVHTLTQDKPYFCLVFLFPGYYIAFLITQQAFLACWLDSLLTHLRAEYLIRIHAMSNMGSIRAS